MAKSVSRRDVLKGSAAVVAAAAMGGFGVRASAEDRGDGQAAKRRLRFGIVGCGGKGWSGMEAAAEFGDIVALADIDADNRSKAMLQHPRACAFDDYRDMFEAMRGRLDAVVVSTPDHHHGPASALAMRQGLHCYTEKPLCRTIWEVRQLVKLARDRKLATQMGNQSTASTNMRKIAALVKAGEFGHAKEVHVWTDRAKGWWPQGVERPQSAPVPPHIDFEVWLGPRPERPYAMGYHPFAWRGFWDFGCGALGDMGCHIFNTPFMSLDLRDPIAIEAQTSGHGRETFPEWSIVHYEFGERNGRAPVRLTWYDGGKRPDASLAPGFELGGNGSLIVCEKGTIYCPDELNTEFHRIGGGGTIPDIKVEESPGHMAEFARAALGGEPARSNFPDYAGPLAETVLLGNLAVWADGKRLEWDAKRMAVKGTDEFDEMLRPTFRDGWSV
ncbi:MAG TPA: Gfo/Idh/MocA family oxidoreductase [Fimbriimonadaceae bacterium]|nr:Gfo/Idh/MocA family oxidoreductase [Fimbriimonadaceae bacterium]